MSDRTKNSPFRMKPSTRPPWCAQLFWESGVSRRLHWFRKPPHPGHNGPLQPRNLRGQSGIFSSDACPPIAPEHCPAVPRRESLVSSRASRLMSLDPSVRLELTQGFWRSPGARVRSRFSWSQIPGFGFSGRPALPYRVALVELSPILVTFFDCRVPDFFVAALTSISRKLVFHVLLIKQRREESHNPHAPRRPRSRHRFGSWADIPPALQT